MRNTSYFLILTAALCCSCSKSSPTENTNPADPPSETPAVQQPEDISSSNDVIYVAGDIRLTIKDYDECLTTHKLKGNEFSKRALANPRFQRDEIQRCYQTALMRKFIDDNKIQIKPAFHQKALQTALEKHGVQSEEALAEHIGVPASELNNLLDTTVFPKIIQEYLAMTIPPEEAKAKFLTDFRKYSIELGCFDNTPTPEEADVFAAEQEEGISAYLNAHPEISQTQPFAQFTRIAYPASDDTASEAYQAVRNAKDIAANQSVDEALKKCHDDEAIGCKVINDKDNPLVKERTDDIAWAFQMSSGAVSDIIRGENTDEIWILQTTTPPTHRDFKVPAQKQQLAIDVMKAVVPAPHLIEKIRTDIEAINPDFKAIAQANGGKFQTFNHVLYMDLASAKESAIPQMLKILATLTPEEINLFSSPILNNGQLCIFRVLEANIPTEDDFKLQENAWKSKLAADSSTKLVNKWLEASQSKLSSINIRPVQNKYGILRPDGSIR